MLKRLQFKSVGMKLFMIFFTAVLLLTSVLGWVALSVSRSIVLEQVSEATAGQLAQAADKVDFLFSQYEGISKQLAVDTLLREDLVIVSDPAVSIVNKTAAEARIRERLNGAVQMDSKLQGVRLVSLDLSTSTSYSSVGSSGTTSSEAIQAKMEHIVKANGQVVWFPTEIKGFMGNETKASISMGRLLKNLNFPRATYVLVIDVKERAIGDMLSNIQIGESGSIRMVTAEGRIVHDPDAQLLMSQSDLELPQQDEAEQGAFYTDQDEMVVVEAMSTAPWVLAGYAPTDDFLQAADKLLWVTLAVIAAAIGIALLLGWFMMRHVGKPLNDMCLLMEQGEQGNLKVRTSFPHRQDEIGRLGLSFNRMMEQISGLADQTRASAVQVLATAEELADVSRSTSQTAGEIAAAMEQVAQGAGSLSQQAENENALAEHIGVQMGRVTQSHEVMQEAADRVLQVAGQGSRHMHHLVEKTEEIHQVNQQMVQRAEQLKDKASSIHKILELMNEIAKQTNILSMNATIEAARAGAAGKGFMVVADEIRELADSSKRSIHTVAGMTREIQEGVQHTVETLNRSAPLFDEQLQSVGEAQERFHNVQKQMDHFLVEIQGSTHSIQELLDAQQELTGSIASAASIVQESSAATEEVASMASQQHKVSERLVGLSGQLEQLSEQLKESLVKFRT
ncbi:methyl-accepting chemotaxis sensory transducer [Paenibacillus algicola]|uniref:Methyl-accepting chemotaxis sensory transducer n=1 Tax=Paenibacillus algicola TaxID=2565926 RepID=A0A4P8XJB1_9BACL|nr:methyl-accepting chemotaxis protein [Paenibacillus algicola]QCT01441.1 methyl-accepting chemotaxis sensory transducer [Paenibacillus algicola]